MATKKTQTIKNAVANLGMVTEIKVDGCETPLRLDFSDKRFVNRLLHLCKRWENLADEIEARFAETDKIEDKFEKLIAQSDIEVDVLTQFKNDVDSAFGAPITETLYGDCLPGVERYYGLFDVLTPYMLEYKRKEKALLDTVAEKYGSARISKSTAKSASENA